MKNQSKNKARKTKRDIVIREDLKEGNFATIHKEALHDPNLSEPGFRLLVCLLNNDMEKWDLHTTYYGHLLKWSRDKVAGATSNLIANGYLKKERQYLNGKKRGENYEHHYEVHERKMSAPHSPVQTNKIPDSGLKIGLQSSDSNYPTPMIGLESSGGNNTNTDNSNSNNINSNKKEEDEINSKRKEESLVLREGNTSPGGMPPSLPEVITFFKSKGYDSAGAFAFFKEFQERNWYSIKGEPVTNWRGMATHFVKTKGASYFVISDEQKQLITGKIAPFIYDLIRAKAGKTATETGNMQLLNFSKSEVRECLLLIANEKQIATAQDLKQYLVDNKAQTTSFWAFKKSLGLSNPKDSGTKYC